MPAAAPRTQETPRSRHRPAGTSAVGADPRRFEPRFRVVQRKSPAPAPRRPPTGSVSRIFALAGIPALLLLAYVLFWTLNMRGAYYRDQLQAQIKALRVERMDLEAEKRRRQSPGQNLARAKAELGMVPAREREFARVSPPASGRLASR